MLLYLKKIRIIIALGALILAAINYVAIADVFIGQRPGNGKKYSIQIDSSRTIRTIGTDFFGFDFDWINFQDSLWDSSAKKVNDEAIQLLKSFPGAIYRFPGGTESNRFSWLDSVGPYADRRQQKLVTWHTPMVAEFGPLELLQFTKAVGGRPWYVLNLYGKLSGELPVSGLAKEAAELVSYINKNQVEGQPSIYRWELGNELDRDIFLWEPEKYIEAALIMKSAVTSVDPMAKFVVMSQDWDASKKKYRLNSQEYNYHVAQSLKGSTEFASHMYYDGLPWGLSITKCLQIFKKNIDATTRGIKSTPSIWVTEHGRTPTGISEADPIPKKNWPQTANLAAAISVADMMISLSKNPAVKGAFLHALHATSGPWPLFHKQSGSKVVPSAVYWSLRILREQLTEEVLATTVVSENKSGYNGGYDLRAVAFSDKKRSQYGVWLINRANEEIQIELSLKPLAGATHGVSIACLSGADANENNYSGSKLQPAYSVKQMTFDQHGNSKITVPANAVMAISFPKGKQA